MTTMTTMTLELTDFHWTMQLLDTLDAGLVVVDREYRVCAWNSFMQHYSGINADNIMGKCLFRSYPNLPERWLKAKLESTAKLKTRGFSNWEDRPIIFEFKNFSPVSQGLLNMYQNMVITPLKSPKGEVTHFAIMLQDVSDIAKSKMHLKRSNEKLTEMGRTDGLTGLFNRAFWESKFVEEFNSLQTHGGTSTLVMFDIDHFKRVNDTYGHAIGDFVIRETAQQLMKAARGSDVCGRYGGEEFAVLLTETTADQASYFAERLRKRIEELSLAIDGHELKYTISLGITEYNLLDTGHLDWLKRADKALYQSKEAGRNATSIL
ncbi:diguanylate cyclase (GGDEF) domain-containing protein [Vibrio hangzhouensis]|uniref:diguanylate cyclase n=2 Tax=Vibrio hangzhouensis TaxID=462991 RepID=A0A1H5XYH2_9VIBR|nr:diguanylate cyclase (GGDEF) domain-containing protein [Vibrio hangzhouensis]